MSFVWRDIGGCSGSRGRIVGLCDGDELWRVSPDTGHANAWPAFLFCFFYLVADYNASHNSAGHVRATCKVRGDKTLKRVESLYRLNIIARS